MATTVTVEEGQYGRELRIGETCASWYQPGKLLTGSVWDALAVPILALPPARRRNVLVLGLGGGTATRLIRAIAPAACIVGVEVEPRVVEAARESFGLDALGLEVHIADAQEYLRWETRRFDLIVEDCFVGDELGLSKPAWLPEPGLNLVAARLEDDGVLACDAVHDAPGVRASLAIRYPELVEIELHDCTNRVFVASRIPLGASRLRSLVSRSPVLAGAEHNLRLRTLNHAARSLRR